MIPIVNENDTVSVMGIKIGDNDTLSALIASMVSADKLVLLTGDARASLHLSPTSRNLGSARVIGSWG